VTRFCRYHCTACNTHFASLEAFDAHRQGDHASNDPELGRHCVHPLDLLDKNGLLVLVAANAHGVCRIRSPQDDVTIWTARRGVGRLEALRSQRAAGTSSQEPSRA